MNTKLCKECLYYVENPYNKGKDICDADEPCFCGGEYRAVSEKQVMKNERNNM